MFAKPEVKRNEFLDKAKNAREERATEKQREGAAIIIQSHFRRYLARCKLHCEVRKQIDDFLEIPKDPEDDYKPKLRPALELYHLIRRFLLVFKENEDKKRFEYLCKYILFGMNQENIKLCYVSISMNKEHVLLWIHQLKNILWQGCLFLKTLKPNSTRDMKTLTTILSLLVTFTNCSSWQICKGKMGEALKPSLNQLCNNVMGDLNSKGFYPALHILLMHGLAQAKPAFKQTTLSAIITLSLRPLLAADFSDNLLSLFLLHILSVPALIHHANSLAQECLITLMTHRIFRRSITLLSNDQSTKIIFNALEGNYALCLLANLIELGNSEMEGLVENTNQFMYVVTKLLNCCDKYVQSKRSNLTHWHPVLGWFSQPTDEGLHDSMPRVVEQLQLLWSLKMIRILFEQLFVYNELTPAPVRKGNSPQSKNLFKKAIEKASTSAKNTSTGKVKMESLLFMSTCMACQLYHTAMKTLTQLYLDILAGLSFQDVLLPLLWRIITDLGPQCGLKAFMDIFQSRPGDTSHPAFGLLHMGCEIASHIIIILDDVELYEQHKPFSPDNLVAISNFLNYFVFRTIWHGYLDVKSAVQNDVFSSAHSLLMILYERDCRRSYTPKDHWLIRDIKPSVFINDLEKGRKSATFLLHNTPHVIPHKERVLLFRRNVIKEKESLGIVETVSTSPQSTLIKVQRSRIIEDGYRQLALLPPSALKGLIRVKFVNEQGLDEAGIDQDGVFKEFLEETISRVFDPSLNLFKVTSEQKLYPSPTSSIQENHLQLFDFVGRMLGKAVYEGIVVDVPFANFFLTHMIGHKHTATYSSIDELPSLDAELYKSLTYIKHYEGDIGDLDLTFSIDEDVLGKLVTHELKPGGRAMAVTNDNKISYIHLMAHFRMRIQIKEQTNAFLKGFKSIVNHEWLSMFSTPELQMLISGESHDLDLEDLRKHTQYYGGFHNNHKVINWLWDILAYDFTVQERSLFLKFVTSCSKAPLLGFSNMEPPFSIRCVEVSDDQDTGDTVGSVLKGFFNIRKRDPVGRLPTASTCFNLLKLPNYQKKSTLREKMKYAITSNTGFELS